MVISVRFVCLDLAMVVCARFWLILCVVSNYPLVLRGLVRVLINIIDNFSYFRLFAPLTRDGNTGHEVFLRGLGRGDVIRSSCLYLR